MQDNHSGSGAALDGLKVIDFSTLLPGPLASLMLARSGAHVTKVEPPAGDPTRFMGGGRRQTSAVFELLNAGKETLRLNLKAAGGRETAQDMASEADILIEQFRPGVMQRFGLDYASVRKSNPRIIYCSITGYGQTGPYRDRAGHDLNYMAEAGLLSLNAAVGGHLPLPPVLTADIAGGAYPAVINILLALQQRLRTGEGTWLDVAMHENTLPFAFHAFGARGDHGRWPAPGETPFNGGTPRYALYPTQDGRWLAVAALEDVFWERFCELIGLEPRLRDDAADPGATRRGIAAIIGSRAAAEWQQRLEASDTCCSVVRTMEEARQDPHLLRRGVFEPDDGAGGGIAALPVPIVPQLRTRASRPLRHPPSAPADPDSH